MRASAAYGGVVLSARNAPGAERPMVQVPLSGSQSEALVGMLLLKPGSETLGLRFDRNGSILMIGWNHARRMAEFTVRRVGREDEAIGLTEAQAVRLGTDIVKCLGIHATALCDHEFVDARNERVISGELCMKCGAIREGNGEK